MSIKDTWLSKNRSNYFVCWITRQEENFLVMEILLTYWWKEANYQQENVRKAVIKLNIKQVTMREKK